MHRPVRAQHRLGQLEQRIRPRGEAPVKLTAEGCQPVPRLTITRRLDATRLPCHAERHGHRLCLQVLSLEPEDHHAVAVPRHGGTPDKIGNPVKAGLPRLDAKLKSRDSAGLTRLQRKVIGRLQYVTAR